jgi:hypothetical protein
MAADYKHKRFFRCLAIGTDSTISKRTFSSTADANTKLGFTSVWNTSSPTKTEALSDSDRCLEVTYEFDNVEDQDAFKSAIDGSYGDSTAPFNPATSSDRCEQTKVEWYNADGSVSSTTTLVADDDLGTWHSPTRN